MSQIEITVVIHESRLQSKGDDTFRTINIAGEESVVNELAKVLGSKSISFDEAMDDLLKSKSKKCAQTDIDKNRRVMLGIGTNPAVIGQV